MRLGKIKMDEWASMATYIDTLVIPVYSVNLINKNIEMDSARMIERISGELERRLAGRVLLLPAIPFFGEQKEVLFSFLCDMLRKLGHSGFTYQVVITDQSVTGIETSKGDSLYQENTLFYTIELPENEFDFDELYDHEMEQLYQEILNLWQGVS